MREGKAWGGCVGGVAVWVGWLCAWGSWECVREGKAWGGCVGGVAGSECVEWLCLWGGCVGGVAGSVRGVAVGVGWLCA